MRHYLHPMLLAADGHPVSIDVIGAGGTGSSFLTHLARIHGTLLARGHLGLHVRVFDPDNVEASNVIRQHYTPHDIGRNKATVTVERLNRFYALDWQAIPLAWNAEWVKNPQYGPFAYANIIVSCVDTVAARRTIWQQVMGALTPNPVLHHRYRFQEDGGLDPQRHRTVIGHPVYWLDMGNARDIGQVILGTFGQLPQPNYCDTLNTLTRLHPGDKLNTLAKATVGEQEADARWNGRLRNLFDFFPDLEDGPDEGPSCSLLEALGKQSIMVNPTIAAAGANLLAQMFEGNQLTYHGCFINLRSLTSTPISIPQAAYETGSTAGNSQSTEPLARNGTSIRPGNTRPTPRVYAH